MPKGLSPDMLSVLDFNIVQAVSDPVLAGPHERANYQLESSDCYTKERK